MAPRPSPTWPPSRVRAMAPIMPLCAPEDNPWISSCVVAHSAAFTNSRSGPFTCPSASCGIGDSTTDERHRGRCPTSGAVPIGVGRHPSPGNGAISSSWDECEGRQGARALDRSGSVLHSVAALFAPLGHSSLCGLNRWNRFVPPFVVAVPAVVSAAHPPAREYPLHANVQVAVAPLTQRQWHRHGLEDGTRLSALINEQSTKSTTSSQAIFTLCVDQPPCRPNPPDSKVNATPSWLLRHHHIVDEHVGRFAGAALSTEVATERQHMSASRK